MGPLIAAELAVELTDDEDELLIEEGALDALELDDFDELLAALDDIADDFDDDARLETFDDARLEALDDTALDTVDDEAELAAVELGVLLARLEGADELDDETDELLDDIEELDDTEEIDDAVELAGVEEATELGVLLATEVVV